jgi:hypothetical protein
MKTIEQLGLVVTIKDMVGAVSCQAIIQSQLFPRNLLTVLEKYASILDNNFFNENVEVLAGIKYKIVKIEDIKVAIELLKDIPEFLDWNLSENERMDGVKVDDKNRPAFNFVTRYTSIHEMDDFIDIDAFIRNAVDLVIRNTYAYRDCVYDILLKGEQVKGRVP